MSGAEDRPVRLTATQAAVLQAVAEGRLVYNYDMGWFQKGGYRLRGGRNPSPATVQKLNDLGFVRRLRGDLGRTFSEVVITDAGRDFLSSASLSGEDGTAESQPVGPAHEVGDRA